MQPSSHTNQHEPLFNLPSLLLVVVAMLIGLHLWVEYGLNPWQRFNFFLKFGFTPLDFYDFHITGDPKFNNITQVILTYVLLFMGEGEWGEFGLNLMRLVSYSFLHGDLAHLGLNLIWLVIFGAPLCRRFGSMRFLLFWVVMAILSALVHFAFHLTSPVPMIGASGVVSGLMGVAARYGFYRGGGVRGGGQLLSIAQALMNKDALVFISVWLIANLAIGFGLNIPTAQEANIAWEAHIGGLVAGFLLVGLFERRKH